MIDDSRAGPDAETPVNPYSLLEAVNNSSDRTHTAWLIFLAINAYLVIAVAGVTHRDLLLETPVNLPIMQVQIQQAQFFQFAPIILVLFHVGVVSQLVLLARKTLEFDYAVRSLEIGRKRNHPLRLELHNFYFVQAIAGPQRSFVMSAFLHAMTWMTLVALPVILLLFIQISFLPYHDIQITWIHRICLVIDIAMLVLIGIFLLRAETSFFSALWRTTVSNPISFLVTFVVLAVVAFFSFFVATIPGEMLDRVAHALNRQINIGAVSGQDQRANSGFIPLPFLASTADGALLGRFHRNLMVRDALDLLDKTTITDDKTSVSLRGRDLRFARLDRSDLSRADLTGANLDGASLVGTILNGAKLQCVEFGKLILHGRQHARCARANHADLTAAQLVGAKMAGIELVQSKLKEAKMMGADLSSARAIGADFSASNLSRSNLTDIELQAANLDGAFMEGANLRGALLHGADLSSAVMTAAIVAHAQLYGAKLQHAELDAADLKYAQLQQADMKQADVRAADLRWANVWQTVPPRRESLVLVDMASLQLTPPTAEQTKTIQAALDHMSAGKDRQRVSERVSPLFQSSESAKWQADPERQVWQSYLIIAQSAELEMYGHDLTQHLTKLMCKAQYGDGSVATGVARRALGDQFRGDLSAIAQILRDKATCPPGQRVPAELLQQLAVAIDLSPTP